MKITITCNIRTRGNTINEATFPYQIPEDYFSETPFDDLTYQDIEEMVWNMNKLDIQVLDFEPLGEITLFKRYRIFVYFKESHIEGQFIYDDYRGYINIDDWIEWGCHSPCCDTIISQMFPTVRQSLLIKRIEFLGEYEDQR